MCTQLPARPPTAQLACRTSRRRPSLLAAERAGGQVQKAEAEREGQMWGDKGGRERDVPLAQDTELLVCGVSQDGYDALHHVLVVLAGE
jgi:hypothetical protein